MTKSLFQAAQGFIGLFDADGNDIPASLEDLLALEAQGHDEALFSRILDGLGVDGHVVMMLVSRRRRKVAKALQIHVWPGFTGHDSVWETAYVTNGVASDPDWDLECALKVLGGHGGKHKLADRVERLVRRHVRYRPGCTDPARR